MEEYDIFILLVYDFLGNSFRLKIVYVIGFGLWFCRNKL